MERFDDLMGITHSTGDAFLDKRLNQNIAYILPQLAIGAGLGLLNKPKGPKVAGGGFDRDLKRFIEPGLEDLQSLYGQGPRVFEGERVAGFDPLQTQAQTGIASLLGTTDPYTRRQEQLLEESLAGLGGFESRLSAAEQERGRGVGFLEDFSRGIGRAEESMGRTGELLQQFQTGLGRTEESLGRGLGFLEDFRGQAGEAQRRLEGVEPGLTRTEALLAESAQRQRDAARGVGLGELDIDKYRSDYMTAVADPALADIERQLQKDIRQLGAQEAKYGQGRGSRGAILEAELLGEAGRSRADIIKQVGKEAYQSALETARQQQAAQYGADVADIDRQSRAAAALAGLGQAEQAAAIGGRGALAGMYGDVAARSLAGATQAGDITRQLGDITGQRLAGVSQADALTSQLAGLAGQRLSAAGQAAGLSGQALDVARAGGMIPGMYTDIAGQFGGLGESAFGRRRTELEALAGVGAERRGLAQERIAADIARFRESDPFGFAQQYLSTVYGAPTIGTQVYQPQSRMQGVLGGITAMSGFMNQGGGIASLAAGGTFSKEEEDEIKEIEDFSDKEYGTKYGKERRDAKLKKGIKALVENKDALTPKNTMIGQQQGRSVQLALQQQARERLRRSLGSYEEGGSIGNYEKGGIINNILKGFQRGYQALKDIKFDEETQSLGKYDPFTGYSPQERVRIGLAMAGQMPEVGQGPLSAAAAGATPVLEQIRAEELTEAETARKARADELDAIPDLEVMKSSAFGDVIELVAQKYKAKVLRDASGKAVGIDRQALDQDAAAKVLKDMSRALEQAEINYQKNPAQFYTLTSRFIDENLGPTKP